MYPPLCSSTFLQWPLWLVNHFPCMNSLSHLTVCLMTWYLLVLDSVAESVERRLPMWKIESLKPSRVKPMTYKINTCCYLAWRSALIGYDKDWLAQWLSGKSGHGASNTPPVGTAPQSCHECALSRVGGHLDMTLDVVMMDKHLHTLPERKPLCWRNWTLTYKHTNNMRRVSEQ